VTSSEAETRRLGRRLGSRLRANDIVLLEGPLGAGKTVLVRGIVEGKDPVVADLVTSQSYVIVGEYATVPTTVHLDLYRVESTEEVVGLGWEELLYGGKLTLVEWPGPLEPLLEPDDPVARVDVRMGEGAWERIITLSSTDERIAEVLEWAAARP